MRIRSLLLGLVPFALMGAAQIYALTVTANAITVTTSAGTYASGDCVGTKLTFPRALITPSSHGELRGVRVKDKAAKGKDLDLVLFASDVASSACADSAAFTPVDADLSKIVAIVPLTTHKSFADNGVTAANNISYNVKSTDSTGALYGYLVSRDAGTWEYVSTTDISIEIQLWVD